jgi:hypothetical protein
MSSRRGVSLVGFLIAILALALCGRGYAEAEGEPAERSWRAGVDVSVYSEYIWRGLDKYDTAVSPSLYLRFPSFCIRATGIAETGGDADMGEIDASFEYFLSAGPVDFSLGYMFYGYDDSPYSDTSEIFGKAAWNTGTPISPSLEMYWDIDEADALYTRFGVAYADSIEKVNYKLLATLGAATDGFSETYFWTSESGLVDFEISFSMILPITEQITFEPFVGYSALIESSLGNHLEDDSNAYVGASLHVVF